MVLAMRARRERGPFCISPPLSRQQGMIRRCCCCGLLSCLQAPLWFRRKRLRTKYYTCTRLLLEKVQVPQVQNFIFEENIFSLGTKLKTCMKTYCLWVGARSAAVYRTRKPFKDTCHIGKRVPFLLRRPITLRNEGAAFLSSLLLPPSTHPPQPTSTDNRPAFVRTLANASNRINFGGRAGGG